VSVFNVVEHPAVLDPFSPSRQPNFSCDERQTILARRNPDHGEDMNASPDNTDGGARARARRAGRRRTAGGPRTRAPVKVWSIDDIRALGAVTDLRTAARILGLSANTAYALAQRDAFPVPLIRAGGQYRVSVQAILAVLDALPTCPPPPSAAGS
jgi:hypothetical protein